MNIFDLKNYRWKSNINYRKHPHQYLVGKGEQGVLICEPYKSEILPFWKFKTPSEAKESSQKIYQLFLDYLNDNDFVGADMARKYLQMGFTRARRYANYKGGKKYSESGETLPRNTGDKMKIKSAKIFYKKWQEAEKNPIYQKYKIAWKKNMVDYASLL